MNPYKSDSPRSGGVKVNVLCCVVCSTEISLNVLCCVQHRDLSECVCVELCAAQRSL